MKRRHAYVSAIIIIISFAFYVLNPACPSPDSIGIAIKDVSTTNIEVVKLEMAITNRLDSPALYYSDGTSLAKSPIIFSAFKTNEIWQYRGGQSGVSGLTEMPSHAFFKSVVQLPSGTKSAKVAMSATILTWRGELAWYLMGTREAYVLNPIAGLLMHSDRKNRSVIVWSTEWLNSRRQPVATMVPN